MPWARPRPCTHSGCPNMQPCATHARAKPRWRDTRGNAQSRGYGADWQSVRKGVLKRDGFKCSCGSRATLVHHEPPISGPEDPARLDPTRCVSMCRPCHERRHGRA